MYPSAPPPFFCGVREAFHLATRLLLHRIIPYTRKDCKHSFFSVLPLIPAPPLPICHHPLNTDILKANEVKSYFAPEPPTNDIFASFSHWVFHVTKVGRVVTITTNFAGHMKASWDNQLLLTLPAEYSPYDWYEIFPHITQGGNTILVGISHDGSVEFNSLGKEINDWLARWCITYIARE